jgi:hypothetical protein
MTSDVSTGGGRSLRRLFEELVWQHFYSDMHLEEPAVAQYVSTLLADFARSDRFYAVRNEAGKPLDDLGEMMVESDPMAKANSFDRERSVRKHMGDYSLFMSGLFPESLAKSRNRLKMRVDGFLDFVQTGKESYAIVSSFDQFEYRDEAPLFRRLSEHFETCVMGLNLVKQDLENFQAEVFRRKEGPLGLGEPDSSAA